MPDTEISSPAKVYVDHASTALPTLFYPSTVSWANPSNHHAWGQKSRDALEHAREQVEAVLGVVPAGFRSTRPRVIFTSGGTEGNNMVLQGGSWAFLLTTSLEHSSVHVTAQWLANHQQCDVIFLPVDGVGRVDASVLRSTLQDWFAQQAAFLFRERTHTQKKQLFVARQHFRRWSGKFDVCATGLGLTTMQAEACTRTTRSALCRTCLHCRP